MDQLPEDVGESEEEDGDNEIDIKEIKHIEHLVPIEGRHGKGNKEKKGGTNKISRDMVEFRDFIQGIEAVDCILSEEWFTWMNRRMGLTNIAERLDRFLTETKWIMEGIPISVKTLPYCLSDQFPIMLEMGSEIGRGGDKIKVWNKETLKNIFNEKDRVEGELDALNRKIMDNGMSKVDFINDKNPKERLVELHIREEIYWRDKAREMWIKDGDKNTKYFHSSVKARQAFNQVSEITLEDGHKLQNMNEIGQAAVEYFFDILNDKIRDPIVGNVELMEDIPRLVTLEDNAMLMAPFTLEEVRKVFFCLDLDKASRPDGFPAHFYQNLLGLHKGGYLESDGGC
ncbi:uncharacterized protein LOC131857630 [Cryptomeria japonica]|uniref:uncharacterized protein LOC131857630 n=1 Tax=Cryptomeria japonica TaxID=3369 RepID=UPI0027D9E928|nr:uncharacterized protein LOC131857630 [Cryptomeria japonica]